MARLASADGFSLPEACVAAGLLATALVTLAGLFTLSVEAHLASRGRTYASVLAQQKVEELRADLGAAPFAGALAAIDQIDWQGQVVSSAAAGQAVFTRRWWVDPLPGGPAGVVLIQVEVLRAAATGAAGADLSRIVTLMRTPAP